MTLGNAWFRIEHDAMLDIVRIVRTAEPLPADGASIGRIFAELGDALQRFAGSKALLDMRGGPRGGRNDAVFEAQVPKATQSLERTFKRVAVLVRTAVGKLQVRRVAGRTNSVFQDEGEALKYLAAS
jgi:hypothetical protein